VYISYNVFTLISPQHHDALPIFFFTQFALHVLLGAFFLITGVMVLWMGSRAAKVPH
jgi:hypothetical protein